jgi:lipoate-protein ligase A
MYNYLPYQVFDGQTNMNIDSDLLDNAIENNSVPTLRIYGWNKPTLTLGRNQPLDSIGVDFCNKNNIDVIRRITGGRAVFHHHEITYSFICCADFLDNGNTVIASYKEISEALILAFNKINIHLSFPEYKKVNVDKGYCMALSTGSDLNYKGKKIIGSAQYRKQNYILQHGSILIDMDMPILTSIFGTYLNRQEITFLKEINPDLDYFNILPNVIKEGFEEKFNGEFLFNSDC